MKKILLIEDEKNIVQIVRDMLEDNGFFVTAKKDWIWRCPRSLIL